MTQLFANNAASELANAVTSSATSLTLKAGGGALFPAPTVDDFFLVTLYQKVGQDETNHEIVKCTARTGDVLTVVRAQEGTVAVAWPSATAVQLRVTAGSLGSLTDAIEATKTALNAKAPLTGVGTSGTWPISITGNAATAPWAGISDKPAVIASGASTAAARAAIGAGTSNLALGASAGATLAASGSAGSATTAAKSDHVHPFPTATDVGAVAASGGAASGLTLNDGYTEEVFAVTGTTPALSPTNGSIQTWALTGNSTPTAGTWASGQSMALMVDDGSASTINWASMSIAWKTGGGTAPTLLTTGYTVIELVKVGSAIYGWLAGDA